MSEIFSYVFLAQAIGILATVFVILSFNQKIDNRLKTYLIIGNLFFAVHFCMLGAFAGMFVNILNAFRVGFSIKFHKSTNMMLVFMGAYLLTAYLIYEELFDLLPILSALLGTFSMFKLSGIKMRLLGLVGSSAWLTYGIIYQSIGGIITETSVIILNLSTIFRLSRDGKKAT